MSALLHAHRAAIADALRQARRAPIASLLSVGVLALALALPLVGFVVGSGLARIVERFDTDPQVAVFLPPEATVRDRQAAEKAIRGRRDVRRISVVTREQALAELQSIEGVRDLLAGLPGNPLPDTLVVTPADPGRAAVDRLEAELARLPGVGSVQADRAWVERLEQVLRTARALTLAVAAMLGLAVVAVTFNTIRLQVATRASELEVAALVGATSAWLRRPFLYFGALQGVGAGVLATALATGFVLVLTSSFPTEAAALALPGGRVPWLGELALTAILVGTGLGWTGAWLSIWEHLGPGRTGPR
jgi:cell division transport system permease protein